MKKTVLGLAALTVLAFAACKKDDNQTNAQKIVGKWQALNKMNVVTNTTTSSLVKRDTATYSSDSYSEFTSNGYLYSYTKSVSSGESRDTVQYKVEGNNLIYVDPRQGNDTVVIKTLTGGSLALYYKEMDGNNLWETTENFKK